MPELGGGGSVQLLEVDPDLAHDLDPRRAREAAQRLYARLTEIPRGRWVPETVAGNRPIALLVLDGLLLREATVGDHPAAELLGPGDVVRAWEDDEQEELLPRSVGWTALAPTRVAVIDRGLAVRAAQWPEVFAALLDRAARRAERLVVLQAIAHLTRVDDRLLALLWCLAERWGRVVPDGVVVSLRLSHRTLAGMVGARRPSVTTALGQLMARGEIERREDGEWVLRGEPAACRARSAGTRCASSAASPAEHRLTARPDPGRAASAQESTPIDYRADASRGRGAGMDDAASPAVPRTDGAIRSAISQAIVQLHADHYGKGATQAKTYVWDNVVVIILRDVLTVSERTLVGADRADLVRDCATSFQSSDGAVASARPSSGSPAGPVGSASCPRWLPPTGYGVEVFILAPVDDERRPTAGPAAADALERLEVAAGQLVLAAGEVGAGGDQAARVREVVAAPDRQRARRGGRRRGAAR